MKPNTLNFSNISNKEYDFIVIGAGMYGAYTASKLAHKSGYTAKILVFDKGDFLLHTHADNLPRVLKAASKLKQFKPFTATINGNLKDTVAPDIAAVGGKSLNWGRWAPRLTQTALENWPERIRVKFGNLYDEVENDMFVNEGKEAFNHDAYKMLSAHVDSLKVTGLLPCELPPLAIKHNASFSGEVPVGVYSSVPGLLSAIENTELHNAGGCIDIAVKCDVTELISGTIEGSKQITGIKIKSKGLTRKILCKHSKVILSAGLAHSTYLASTVSNNPNIGNNLTTHLRSNVICRAPKSSTIFSDWDFSKEPQISMHIPGTHNGKEFHLQFHVEHNDRGHAGTRQYYLTGSKDDAMYKQSYADQIDKITLRIYIVGEKEHQSSYFNPAKNAAHWYVGDQDESMMENMTRAGRKLAHELLGTENVEWEFNYSDWTSKPVESISQHYEPVSSSYHETSTLIMGDHPQNSVVDPEGRFHDIHNLYCVDQSVFPQGGSGNPVPTGKAVALNMVNTLMKKDRSPVYGEMYWKGITSQISSLKKPPAFHSDFKLVKSGSILEAANTTAGASMKISNLGSKLADFIKSAS